MTIRTRKFDQLALGFFSALEFDGILIYVVSSFLEQKIRHQRFGDLTSIPAWHAGMMGEVVNKPTPSGDV